MRLSFATLLSPLLLLGCGLSMNPDLPSAEESGGDSWSDGGVTDGDIDIIGDPEHPISTPPQNEGLGGAMPCNTMAGAAGAGHDCRELR